MPQPWSPYEPRPGEWTLRQAGHLLRRTTFGFTAAQLRQAYADGPQKTIDRLLAPPPGYAAFESTLRSLTPREPKPVETEQLALYRIGNSPWPLHEKAELVGPAPDAIRQWLLGSAAADSTIPETDTLATLLRSLSFFSLRNYRCDAKSPLEFALNLSIALEAPLPPAALHTQLVALGQNPARLAARRRWLNPFTLIARANLASTIAGQAKQLPDRETLLETFLQNDLPAPAMAALSKLDGRDLVLAIANRPEFQML